MENPIYRVSRIAVSPSRADEVMEHFQNPLEHDSTGAPIMVRSALLIGLFISIAHDAFADDKGRRNRRNQNNTDSDVSNEGAAEADVPDDDQSRAFSERLLENPYRGYRPHNQLRYTEMVFQADNTWTAQGEQRLQGSATLPCTESGTWSMETATAEDTAVVEWTVATTDCLGRTAGAIARGLITIDDDGNYSILRR